MRVLLVLAMAVFGIPAEAGEVVDVRVWPLLDRTRIEIGIEGSVDHEVFSVDDPHRLVVDLKDARWSAGLPEPVVDTAELSGLRWAARDTANLRLVFDLRQPVETRTELLPVPGRSGHWLVLEVLSKTPPALPVPGSVAAPGPGKRPDQGVRAGRPAAVKLAAAAPTKPAVRAAAQPAETPARQPVLAGGGRKVVVAIDAGHGGVDPGAEGRSGAKEKAVTLAIAKELARRIDAEPGMRAVLVRDRDVFVPLRQRMEIARKHRADLFISIHADAFRDADVRGSSVYVLSERGASSEQARWLAERENAADLVGGVALDHPDPMVRTVLLDLAQTGTLGASERVAAELLKSLNQVGRVHRKQVQHAGFAVLKSPDVPSVLVETAFISNPEEERRLTSRKHQKALANAILGGVREYFAAHAPDGTQLAQRRTRSAPAVPMLAQGRDPER
jgi:N-acetylmuramoyl-L-alanine amidase